MRQAIGDELDDDTNPYESMEDLLSDLDSNDPSLTTRLRGKVDKLRRLHSAISAAQQRLQQQLETDARNKASVCTLHFNLFVYFAWYK